jgi:DNA topoisomerase-1
LAKTAKMVFFATDEDREGEAISWHLNYLLKPKNFKRIAFHEITKTALEKALENPRELDENLVNAQQARRILDRLVGYKLSPFLWKKISKGLSAGRVQSAAVRLICDKEDEIRNFKSQEYWKILADFFTKEKTEIKSELTKINKKSFDKFEINSNQKSDDLISQIKSLDYKISNVESNDVAKNPLAPFTTSTLQQSANNKLGFSSKQTMLLAQQLYEGIEIHTGSTGLITYMRTDSVNLSEGFIASCSKFIKENLGEQYSNARKYKTKSKNAQEAHEAIRPTSVENTPEKIEQYLDAKQFKLYKLIWERAVASQMSSAKIKNTKIEISDDAEKFTFVSSGNIIIFDGFMKIYKSNVAENQLPEVNKNDAVELKNINGEQKFTEAPARYNEASLIKAMEKLGIGRPSTYAPTISTIIARKYVIKEQKRLIPTEIGELVNKMLKEEFPEIVDYQFTANIESGLDEIAIGKKQWRPFLSDFYKPFEKKLLEKYESVEKVDTTEETDQICEKCGSPMVIKFGRFGKFIACSNFPECKNTKTITEELNINCPICKTGAVIIKRTKRGKIFYGCKNYPECKFASWSKPTGNICEKCGSPMVEFRNQEKCSNKDCKKTKKS